MVRAAAAQRAQVVDADTGGVRLRTATGTPAGVGRRRRRRRRRTGADGAVGPENDANTLSSGVGAGQRRRRVAVQAELAAVVRQVRLLTAAARVGQTVVIDGRRRRSFHLFAAVRLLLVLLQLLLHSNPITDDGLDH